VILSFNPQPNTSPM